MSVYQWSTGPGTRIEPDAGEKVSGFVPSTPAAAKKLNDILYELTNFAIDYQTKFAVEHDPSDGTHTNVTANSLNINGNLSISNTGALTTTAGIVAGSGVYSGSFVAAVGNVSGSNFVFNTPYCEILQKRIFNNIVSNPPGSLLTTDATSFAAPLEYDEFPKVFVGGDGEEFIQPIEIQADKDFDEIKVTFVAGIDYNIDYEVLIWTVFNGWLGAPITSGNFSDTVSSDGELITVTISIPDLDPDVVGHGRKVDSNTFFGLRLKNSNTEPLRIVYFMYYETKLWATSVEGAIP